MGWVVLTLRKKELKATHAGLQMRDLQIAREQRQKSREYNYEQSVIQKEQSDELRDLKDPYNSQRKGLKDQISAMRNDEKENDGLDHSGEISDLQEELQQAQLDYTESVNESKSFFESELAMIEEEANDVETQFEQEKTGVEAQMESVSQEIQSVSDAISNAIQQSTIKLS